MTPFGWAIAAIVVLSLLGLPVGHAMIAGSLLYFWVKGVDMATLRTEMDRLAREIDPP